MRFPIRRKTDSNGKTVTNRRNFRPFGKILGLERVLVLYTVHGSYPARRAPPREPQSNNFRDAVPGNVTIASVRR